MNDSAHIEYFISGHGYGHGVRSCAIINKIPLHIKVTIRSSLPREFFCEELRRDFDFLAGEFDYGCAQLDGVRISIPLTVENYSRISKRNKSVIDDEVAWSRTNKVTLIVSDIAPVSFEIAKCAGIPSIAIGNFSWLDIYEPFAVSHPSIRHLLEEINSQYAKANLLLELSPANAMCSFAKRIKVPTISRGGRNRREEIADKYNFDPSKKIAVLYTGNYGMNGVNWKRLEEFSDWIFIGVYPVDPCPNNFRVASKSEFPFPDLTASADAVVAKLGYGIVSECLTHGLPVIYLPREDFAEHEFLVAEVNRYGYGIPVSDDQFRMLDIRKSLDKAEIGRRSPASNVNGAEIAAGILSDPASYLV